MRPIRTCRERSTDSGCGWGAVLHPGILRCACNTLRCASPRAYQLTPTSDLTPTPDASRSVSSPQIILPDADLDAAIAGTAMGLFFNQGEVCAACTRVVVHQSGGRGPRRSGEGTASRRPARQRHDSRRGDQRFATRSCNELHRSRQNGRRRSGRRRGHPRRARLLSGLLADTEEKVVTIIL
jgi:hypothetical protein